MTKAAHHPAQLTAMQETRQVFAGYIPGRITNSSSVASYRTDYPIWRPGATEHELKPSRMGDKLFYRDGRVETA